MIRFQRVSKSFRRTLKDESRSAIASFLAPKRETIQAICEVTFEVGEGEFVGYIGPNGAGKSTTMKCLSGVVRPDAGLVNIHGHCPWEQRSAFNRSIGVVFGQKSLLNPDLSPADAFTLVRAIYDIPSGDYEQRLRQLSDSFQIEPYVGVPVRKLSLGQRMRCELIAALLHRPSVLILDEPTIGLDFASKTILRSVLKTLQVEQGLTLLITSHDMTDVESLCGRLIVIQGGRITYDGGSAELRSSVHDEQRVHLTFDEEVSAERLLLGIDVKAVASRTAYELSFTVDPKQLFRVLAEVGVRQRPVDIQIEKLALDQVLTKWYANTASN